MKYIRLYEDFEKYLKPLGKLERTGDSSYDPYELMLIPPGKKAEMIMKECEFEHPNVDLIRDLVAMGADLDWYNESLGSPLRSAVVYGKLEVCKILLEAGATLDSTLLHISIFRLNLSISILKFLLDAGADPNALNHNEETPLHSAARFTRNTEVFRMLLEAGADPNVKDGFTLTPLHHAALVDLRDVIVLFLEYGADINVQGKNGDTALSFAISDGYYDLVKLLLEKGADPYIEAKNGMNAFELAEKESPRRTIRLLDEYKLPM